MIRLSLRQRQSMWPETKNLEKLNPKGKSKIEFEKLLEAGYNTTYHTYLFHTEMESVYLLLWIW